MTGWTKDQLRWQWRSPWQFRRYPPLVSDWSSPPSLSSNRGRNSELVVGVNNKPKSNICSEFSVEQLDNKINNKTQHPQSIERPGRRLFISFLILNLLLARLLINFNSFLSWLAVLVYFARVAALNYWFRCYDDARVDYTSLLGLEDRRKRFSEELLDTELRDSVQLQKMYRELQRQINCWHRSKVRPDGNPLLW